MSLRVRLAVLATAIFVTILAIGTVLVVAGARRAVADETRSTATLALELLELAYTDTGPSDRESLRDRLVERMSGIDDARHLSIALIRDTDALPLSPETGASPAAAPAWFADRVRPHVTEFTRTVGEDAGAPAVIVVRADPADEIAESWQDARTVLGVVAAFALITNVVFYVALGRWLKPLGEISAALDGVQRGDYRKRLPVYELPELAGVASRFNRMVGVLEDSRDENRLLTQRNLEIQEAERRALAHELHDELGQSISAIRAVAVSIDRTDTAREAEVRSAARTIADISARIYSVVRGMMTRLRPVLLDEFGLVPALEALVDAWNARGSDQFCRFAAQGDFGDLSDEIRIGVYRIVQEALTNVGKHSRATEVTVSIIRRCGEHGDVLAAVIADDGAGFEPGTAKTGLGLLGMRERVHALGGYYALDTALRRGVEIRFDIPLAPRVAA